MKTGFIALLLILMSCSVFSATNPQVTLHTSKGDITIELDAEKAPISTKNFLEYVNDGFYSGTVFHRVISYFMIQGGGMTADLKKKATRAPIKNEASNGLQNLSGTIAMARTNDPDSATAQFYINVQDNPSLDHAADSPSHDNAADNPGYAVFGKVIDGMAVVNDIRFAETGYANGMDDVPTEAITILSAEVISQ